MNKNRINTMYWAGYCDRTITHAAKTRGGPQGRESQMDWASTHFSLCEHCTNANVFKALEYETAIRMGQVATLLFQQSGNITQLTGFGPAFSQTMDSAIASGLINPKIHKWLALIILRRCRDWPHLDQVPVDPGD